MFTGLIGLLIFVADIWAIFSIFKSRAKDGEKILWCLLVLILPLLGLIIWYLAGPKN